MKLLRREREHDRVVARLEVQEKETRDLAGRVKALEVEVGIFRPPIKIGEKHA